MLIALRPTQETIDIVAALKGRWHGSYAMGPSLLRRPYPPSSAATA